MSRKTNKPPKAPQARKPREPRVVAKVRLDVPSDIEEYLRGFVQNAADIAHTLLMRRSPEDQKKLAELMNASVGGVLTLSIGLSPGRPVCVLLDFNGTTVEEIVLPDVVVSPPLH